MHPVLDATVTGDTTRLRALLDAGEPVSYANPMGQTALHFAARSGAVDIVTLLLDRGADVDARDQWGNPPLWGAVFESHSEVVRVLRGHGADPLAAGCAQFARAERPSVAPLFDDLPRALPVPKRIERPVMTEGEIPLPGGKQVLIGAEAKRLWTLLVPARGAAPTVQGEVTRACGRLADEAFRNGNGNWGSMHEAMCDFLSATLADPVTFAEDEVSEIRDVLVAIRAGAMLDAGDPKASGNPYNRLTFYGVRWCLMNRALVPYARTNPPRPA